MSANNAVTVLRSPSAVSISGTILIAFVNGCAGVLDEREVLAAFGKSDAPQSPQKPSPGGFSAPHLVHRLETTPPHFPQKRRPSRISSPHFEQRIFAGPVTSLPIPQAGLWRL
jgi:hypothetical protein